MRETSDNLHRSSQANNANSASKTGRTIGCSSRLPSANKPAAAVSKTASGNKTKHKLKHHLDLGNKGGIKEEKTNKRKGSVSPYRGKQTDSSKKMANSKHSKLTANNDKPSKQTASTDKPNTATKSANFQDLLKLAARNSVRSKSPVVKDGLSQVLDTAGLAGSHPQPRSKVSTSRDCSPLGKALVERVGHKSIGSLVVTSHNAKLESNGRYPVGVEGRQKSAEGRQNDSMGIGSKNRKAASGKVDVNNTGSELTRRPLRKQGLPPSSANKKGTYIYY